MLKKVEKYICNHNLLKSDSKIIVGVSGGADSVALLAVLNSLCYKCVVAHCNFKLRGDESQRDALFVEELAEKLNLPFYKVEFDTNGFARENKMSVELAARELRYNWFEEIRKQCDADAIAVAHHAGDNVESLLMNLTRGTGIRGLTAIPRQNGRVVRPLLECTRSEIMGYLMSIGQRFVTDASNAENKYTRNKFRNEIIPLFEKINPSFSKTINNSIKRFGEVEEIYMAKVEAIKTDVVSVEGDFVRISIPKLLLHGFSNSVLFEILTVYNFHPDTIGKIHDRLNAAPGAVFYSNTHRLLHDREFLMLTKIVYVVDAAYFIDEDETEIVEPFRMQIRKRTGKEILRQDNAACFDAGKLQFPLKLRRWKKGDVFVPFGMTGTKKISDFLIDNKINRFEKENIWLLLSGDDVVWVVGYRTDNRYKVSAKTTEVVDFQLLGL